MDKGRFGTGYMDWWAERNISEDMDETGTNGNTHTPKPFEVRDETWVWPTPQWHLQKPVLREPKGTRKCAFCSNNNVVGTQMTQVYTSVLDGRVELSYGRVELSFVLCPPCESLLTSKTPRKGESGL